MLEGNSSESTAVGRCGLPIVALIQAWLRRRVSEAAEMRDAAQADLAKWQNQVPGARTELQQWMYMAQLTRRTLDIRELHLEVCRWWALQQQWRA